MSVASPFRHAPRLIPFVAGLFASAFSVSFADETAPDNKVVKLPDVVVTDSAILPEPEAWRHTKFGDIDVLSNATDISTKRLLVDLNKFQRGMHLVWPQPPPKVVAASLIFCSKPRDFAQFETGDQSAPGIGGLSLFVSDREQAAILVNLAADNIAITDATTMANTNATAVDYTVDHYRQLYREYVHFLMSHSETRLPAWLEEGVAQIVMDIDLTDRTLIYGKIDSVKGAAVGINIDDGSGDTTDSSVDTTSTVGEQPFNIVLLHQKLIPLGQFLAIGHDSPEARNPLGNNLWAKQAYLFVHFCLFGENLRYKDSLALFVQQLAHEPLSEDLFKKCFKVSYTDMEKQLRGYILNTRHKYQKYTLDPANKLDSQAIELADATPATVGLIKGDALRLAGKSAAAVAEYRIAYARGARDPALLAGYGEAELALGNKDRAHALLDAASQAGVDRPSAYVRLAELRLADGKGSPRGPNGQLDSGQVGAVLTPLFKARNFPPPLPETYKLIAETWSLSAVSPSPGNLAVLDEGIRKFPRQSPLLYQSAQLYQRIGQNEQAAAIARLGIRFPADAAAKAQFEQLLATLPPPPPAKQ